MQTPAKQAPHASQVTVFHFCIMVFFVCKQNIAVVGQLSYQDIFKF